MKLLLIILSIFTTNFIFAQGSTKTKIIKTKAIVANNKKPIKVVEKKQNKTAINLKALNLKKVDKNKKNTKADLVRIKPETKPKLKLKPSLKTAVTAKNKLVNTKNVSNKNIKTTNNKINKSTKILNTKIVKNNKLPAAIKNSSSNKEKNIAIVKRTKKVKATTSQIAKMQYLKNLKKSNPVIANNKTVVQNKKQLNLAADNIKQKVTIKKVVKPKMPSNDERIRASFNEAFTNEKLLFPIENGEIITGFGVHPCDDAKGLKCLNPGITIRGEQGAEVKAAFNGIVTNVIEEDENHYTIFLMHNDKFMTTYSGLQNIQFEKGDVVNRADVLGEITLDNETNEPIVEFLLTELITKNQKNIDPRKYLAK